MVDCVPLGDTARASPRYCLIGYNGQIPEYRCRPYQQHGLSCCELRVEIPINPEGPWTRMVIVGDLDEAVEKMAHLSLTAICEQRLRHGGHDHHTVSNQGPIRACVATMP
jgi:hypothetical protein